MGAIVVSAFIIGCSVKKAEVVKGASPSAVITPEEQAARVSEPTDNQAQVKTKPSAPTKAIDPVCGMQITVGDQTPKYEYQGKTYYFCSDECKKRFADDPSKYLEKIKKGDR